MTTLETIDALRAQYTRERDIECDLITRLRKERDSARQELAELNEARNKEYFELKQDLDKLRLERDYARAEIPELERQLAQARKRALDAEARILATTEHE